MKIAIAVYSQTGNTLGVAEKLKAKLAKSGHDAAVIPLKPSGDPRNPASLHYDDLPDLSAFDAVVLAAPVQGFQLSAGMKAFLPHLPELSGKRTACFATKQLLSAWSGGNRALKTMSGALEKKGGKVAAAGFVCWKSGTREKDIEELVEKVTGALG